MDDRTPRALPAAVGRARRRSRPSCPGWQVTGPPDTLASRLAVTAAGAAAVGASLLAATAGRGVPVALDTRQLAVALRSERYLRRDGASPGSPFDPLSAFHRTADGWLRLHANYPWHRAAALRVLGCAGGRRAGRDRRAGRRRAGDALHAAGGVGAAVRTAQEWARRGRPAAAAGRAARPRTGPGPAGAPRRGCST